MTNRVSAAQIKPDGQDLTQISPPPPTRGGHPQCALPMALAARRTEVAVRAIQGTNHHNTVYRPTTRKRRHTVMPDGRVTLMPESLARADSTREREGGERRMRKLGDSLFPSLLFMTSKYVCAWVDFC